MTNLLYMLRQMQGTELLLSYFLVMEQMSEPKITICMSLSYTLIVFIVDIGQYMKNASAIWYLQTKELLSALDKELQVP